MNFLKTHKVFSVILSLVVLFSTFSLTIEKHFCGGVLIDVAVFTQIEKCADDVVSVIDTAETVKKTCCKDEVDVIEGLDQLTTNTFEDLEDIQQQVLFAYSYSYINLFETLPSSVYQLDDYSPPLLIKDIQVLDQTYLI
ncbi:hypothetical protein OAB88_05680 [Winogradskyella sp.]|nr:hypothetical protein [Winogradskyella sp.]MDC1504479.1 hypothetical protein [Winogradskyella sp.]